MKDLRGEEKRREYIILITTCMLYLIEYLIENLHLGHVELQFGKPLMENRLGSNNESGSNRNWVGLPVSLGRFFSNCLWLQSPGVEYRGIEIG